MLPIFSVGAGVLDGPPYRHADSPYRVRGAGACRMARRGDAPYGHEFYPTRIRRGDSRIARPTGMPIRRTGCGCIPRGAPGRRALRLIDLSPAQKKTPAVWAGVFGFYFAQMSFSINSVISRTV